MILDSSDPHFVISLEDVDHTYFFFRETAIEYTNVGKSVYSRVARVYKNDEGGFVTDGPPSSKQSVDNL